MSFQVVVARSMTEFAMTEALQWCSDEGTKKQDGMTLNLYETDESVNRARGEPRYWVTVFTAWGESFIARQTSVLIDRAGKPLDYTLAEAATLAKKLAPGGDGPLKIVIRNAASLPTKWNDSKIRASRAKVKKIKVDDIRAEARAKRDLVANWAEGPKKQAMLESADHLTTYAQALEQLIYLIKKDEEAKDAGSV